MRALVKARKEPGLWMEDLQMPVVGEREALIQVKQTGICGTDIHIYDWDEWSQRTIRVPMPIGHEFMGEVVAMGRDVTGLAVGDRVSGEGHIHCEHCRNCRAGLRHLCRNAIGLGVHQPGCFAEYFALPAVNVFKLPKEIPDEVAAFFDPLGNAVHAVLSFNLVGEDVLITGAGPIGMMAAAIAHHVGSRHVVVTDINEYRLALAKRLGATRTVNITKESLEDVMKSLDINAGFDVGLEMSGNKAALQQMLQVMHHGGRMALLGIPKQNIAIDWHQVIFKGLMLKGIYGREMFETWYKMTSMLQSGLDVSAVVTHRFPASEFQRGFEVMRSGMSGKVIIDWRA